MHSIIDQFLSFGLIERQFSDNTVNAYKNDLNFFFHWIHNKEKNIKSIKQQEIIEYFMHRKKNGLAFSSIARNIFCLRIFFQWMLKTNQRLDDPTEFIETPKIWSFLPEVLSPQEIQLLIDNASVLKEPFDFRFIAQIELLFGCGLRVSELLNIKLMDVDFKKKYLKCYGKGSKERLIPFGKKVDQAIKKYSTKSRSILMGNRESDYLFVSRSKGHMTRQQVWYDIKKVTNAAGIEKNIHPHIFRHSFATQLLIGGGDLRIVQELLGHSSITTTQKYTQIDKTRLQSTYQKFHPRAQ